MIYKRLHRKLKIQQRESQYKLGVNPCVSVGVTVPVPLVSREYFAACNFCTYKKPGAVAFTKQIDQH